MLEVHFEIDSHLYVTCTVAVPYDMEQTTQTKPQVQRPDVFQDLQYTLEELN